MSGKAPLTEDDPLPDPIKRNWYWLTFQLALRLVFAVVLRYRARGLEHIPKSGGGLILVNHQSSLDPLLAGIGLQRPISYVARDSLFSLPFIGWVLRNTYVVPINRNAASSRVIKTMVRRMKHGFLIGMFPEGTRSEDGTIGPFKPGFIAMIRRCEVPIYPVGIAGANDAMPRGVLIPRFRRVRVVYGEPFLPEEIQPLLKERREDEVIARVRERIQTCQQTAEAWRKHNR